MTIISQTNERDERKQISEALTSVEADITTNTADIATNTSDIADHETRITALEGGVNGSPPTALNGVPVSNADITDVTPTTIKAIGIESAATTSTYDTWETIRTETGDGVITFMVAYQTANVSNLDAQLRLTVDSTVVYLSDANLWAASGDNGDGACLVGAMDDNGMLAFGSLPYSTGFTLDYKITENSAGTVAVGARVRDYEV